MYSSINAKDIPNVQHNEIRILFPSLQNPYYIINYSFCVASFIKYIFMLFFINQKIL